MADTFQGPLDAQNRTRTHSRVNRERLCPPHWGKSHLQLAIDSIDSNLGGLVSAIATALNVDPPEAARSLTTYSGLFALMGIPAVRTAVATMQTDVETAAGLSFAAAGGPRGNLVGRRRFAELLRAVTLRRMGEYPDRGDQ